MMTMTDQKEIRFRSCYPEEDDFMLHGRMNTNAVKQPESKFDIPNPETKAALDEIAEMKAYPEKYKSYSSFQEVLDEVLIDA